MKLIALLPLLLAFTFAGPALARDKTYAEVRHLYEKALLAAEETEESFADASYAELSWELMEFGDLELLARMPTRVTDDVFLAEVTANLALAHARAGDCPAALQRADLAFSESLVETLTRWRLVRSAWTPVSSIVRSFTRCGAIERIEEAIADDEPGHRVIAGYLANADSLIASSLYLAGDLVQAERYVARAKERAQAIGDETKRSYALHQIAVQQIFAGRLEDALETANAIAVTTDRRPIGPTGERGGYQAVKNELLEMIAFRFALQEAWNRAFAALDSRTVHTQYFPESFVFLWLERAKSHMKAGEIEGAGKGLSRMEWLLRDHGNDRGLLLLARALAELGAEVWAAELLDDLYEEHLVAYRETQSDKPKTALVLQTLDSILATYVLIRRPQDALDRLASEPLADVKVDSLLRSWSALFGHAVLHEDAALLRRVEPVLENASYRRSRDRGAFAYLLERRAFAEAERFIEGMEATLRPGAYSNLSRELMGISYWEDVYNRQSRGF